MEILQSRTKPTICKIPNVTKGCINDYIMSDNINDKVNQLTFWGRGEMVVILDIIIVKYIF